MFRGTVSFRAPVKGNGMTFPLVGLNPHAPDVDKIELKCPDGDEITVIVYFNSVETRERGEKIAEELAISTLNKLSYLHALAIGKEQITSNNLIDIQAGNHVLMPCTGSVVLVGEASRMLLSIQPATLKAQLEQITTSRTELFGLFRSARLSLSPVEEFMHLYNILLMLFRDVQPDVDAFIVNENPGVPQTPDPRPHVNRMETVYTRLRNELGHHRVSVNLDNTKAEMSRRVSELASLAKRAIELQP
jgi:hypothetical protein